MSFTHSSQSRGRHRVAIALGSNIGDRAGNIVAALHKLRSYVFLDCVSSVYETKPVGYTEQPDFLNLACTGFTDVPPRELRDKLAKTERQVGRHLSVPLGPRAIDLDLLLYDDLIMHEEDCMLPHPGLQSRAFVLIPLAEISPNLVDPQSGKTIGELAAAVDKSGVKLREGGLLTRIRNDIQNLRPSVPLSLNRVGITGVKTVLAIDPRLSRQGTSIASLDIYADLDAEHSGVHMSRFSQDLEDALAELGDSAARGVDELAVNIAQRVVDSQGAERAEVVVRADLALDRVTPASALATREFSTMLGRAVVTQDLSRRLLGVEVFGMTACPCAQGMVVDYTRERLAAEGFSEMQIERIQAAVPMATHNQRGLGTLMVGDHPSADIRALIEIVEQSMSSETYDLLKRPDELFVVNKAHQTPRFVEDVVREMMRYAHDAFADVSDDAFVFSRQTNFESIHKHDAVAESCATLGELRRELRGEPGVQHTTLEQWLRGSKVHAS